jgi:hypothetical protein
MKTNQFEISSEQTFHLQELRKALTDTLHAKGAEENQFPVSRYSGCGAVCMDTCTGHCVSSCSSSCTATCTGMCSKGCTGVCVAGNR